MVELYIHFIILLNGIMHNYTVSPNNIRMMQSGRMRWSENVARIGEMRNAYKILVRKLERERLPERPVE
jgi:hypothetical protein